MIEPIMNIEKPLIYLDNNATTRIAPEVFEAMKPFLTDFYANASSAYRFSLIVKEAIAEAREKVAELLGASDVSEIIFTSGGTESNNHALLSALEIQKNKKNIVISSVEHEAVNNICEKIAKRPNEFSKNILRLEVDNYGNLNLPQLRDFLGENTAVVSTMLANNETGVLFPVTEIAEIVKTNSDALFHVDGVQAVGKIPLNLKETKIDLFSISGHKFHAPKGVGALYVRKGLALNPFLIGGGQENGQRAGTEAVAQIVGLGKAAELARNLQANAEIKRLRDKLEKTILEKIPQTKLIGDKFNRLPNTSIISFLGCEGEAILAHLNTHNICVSTGSACNAENHSPSRVLQAMNIPFAEARGAVRFSLGKYNTEAEIDFVLGVLPPIIEKLRGISGFNE